MSRNEGYIYSHHRSGPIPVRHTMERSTPNDSRYLPRPRIDLGLRTRTALFPIRDMFNVATPAALIETETNLFVRQDLLPTTITKESIEPTTSVSITEVPIVAEPEETTGIILVPLTEKVIASSLQGERTKKDSKKKSIGIKLAGKHELIESTPSRIDKLGHKSRTKLFTNIKKYLKFRREGFFPSHWQEFGEKYEDEIKWYVQRSALKVN